MTGTRSGGKCGGRNSGAARRAQDCLRSYPQGWDTKQGVGGRQGSAPWSRGELVTILRPLCARLAPWRPELGGHRAGGRLAAVWHPPQGGRPRVVDPSFMPSDLHLCTNGP